MTGRDNIFTAPEYSGGGDGKNWLHVGAHVVLGMFVGTLIGWLVALHRHVGHEAGGAAAGPGGGLERAPAVQQQGDGAAVHEAHVHVGPEHALRHGQAGAAHARPRSSGRAGRPPPGAAAST